MNLEILFEDDHLMVLNKPVGMAVHTETGDVSGTLVEWVIGRYPNLAYVGEDFIVSGGKQSLCVPRAGIVHRLDRETSGVIAVAKDEETFQDLKDAFQSRTVKKYYEAFVYGSPRAERGLIDTPFGRAPHDPRLRTARGPRGTVRNAVTRYSIIKTVKTDDGTFSLMALYPATGRTHQLRVHMAHIGHPIVSDGLYAARRPHVLGFNRVALHARKLTLPYPEGKEMIFEAPYPADFQAALDTFKNE
jgi:23S rRNA pseudouridine1911/1915/1917 synthase